MNKTSTFNGFNQIKQSDNLILKQSEDLEDEDSESSESMNHTTVINHRL